MPNAYYKKSDIVDGTFYRAPRYLMADFSGIKAREIHFSDGDRLDIIAEIEYGNASYWRALAVFNNISYFFAPQPGDIIRLPYKIKEVLERM